MRRHLLLAVLPAALLAFACSSADETAENGRERGLQSPSNPKPGNPSNPSDPSGSPNNPNNPANPTPTATSTSTTPVPVPTSTNTGSPSPFTPPPDDKPWDGSAIKGSVPLTGGTLILLSDGVTAVAADPDRDMVSIVDLASKTVKAQIELPTGAEPGRLAEDSIGRVHVVLRRGGGIADIDVASGKLLGLRQVCALPRGIAHRGSDDTLLVSCLAGDIVTMSANPGTKEPISKVKVTYNGAVVYDLRDVIVRDSGLYVTTFRQAQILSIDAAGKVLGYPLAMNTRVDTSKARIQAEGLSGGVEQNYVPAGAWHTVVGPKGDFVVIHHGGTDRIIDVSAANGSEIKQKVTTTCSSSGYGGSSCSTQFGKPICSPPIMTGLISSVSENGEVFDGPALPQAALPVDIAVAPDSSHYSVILAGNPSGTKSDAGKDLPNLVRTNQTVDQSIGAQANIDLHSRDLCGLESTNGGIIIPGQPTSVAIDPQGNDIVLTREPAALHIANGSGVVATIPLSGVSVANEGYDLFHTNTGRGVACGNCHLEGGDDARTWNFTPEVDVNGNPVKIRSRRTQTFRAGFLDTAPFHWDAEFPGIQDLMNDVFVHRMAAATLPSAERQNAFEKWLNNLPPKLHDKPTAEQAQAIASGKALFESNEVGCTSCHSGYNFTNNQNADIGLGTANQVPTLIDIAYRAPFLHDGSVPTLWDRFFDPTAKSGKHGKTDHLSEQQIRDLVAYLESL